jgi:hypothetical protein
LAVVVVKNVIALSSARTDVAADEPSLGAGDEDAHAAILPQCANGAER